MIHGLIIFVGVLVGWCLGIRLFTSKGYLLYFMRKPFDKTKNIEGVSATMSTTLAMNGVTQYVLPRWIAKMTMVCITCMSGFHGGLIFTTLVWSETIELNFIILILGVTISAFIQTFILALYEKIIGHELF